MDTIGSLSFLSAHTHNPSFIIREPGTPAERRGDYYDLPTALRDGRLADAGWLGLEQSGFELRHAPTVADFTDDDTIRASYYPEIDRLARAATGADRVVIIDHTLRSSAAGHAGRGIVTHVHNDYTPASATGHAGRLWPASARNGRVLQINLWRPLSEPVESAPIALADGRTIRSDDLVPCTLVYPDRQGEIFELRHYPGQVWYWFPRMMRDEVLIFKGHDSDPRATVRHVPHTAFRPEDEPADAPPRTSIEVRAFCYFNDGE